MSKTINLVPTWESLHALCKDGEFPKIYEELLKPCLMVDTINKMLEEGGIVKISKDENGQVYIESEKE